MKKYGCIGKKLTHSFSKEIHGKLADYNYELIELTEEEITPFFEKKEFAAINVTIPYKQTVIPFLDSISEIASRIGAVNTIVNKNGKLYGYNTDYYGMKALIEKIGVSLSGKKVLILGTGGTSKTARVVATDLGAAEILNVSRRKADDCVTYEEVLETHLDANVIINTTPSGMYPECQSKPIDIEAFNELEGVVDAVYNPLCTNLVLDARNKNIKAEGGLYMLVMQAVVAVEKFLDTSIDKTVADEVFSSILSAKENIVLTGMPGSGKSTVGKLLDIDGFKFVDTDAEIENRCGCSIKELINTKGEKYFRDLETDIIREVSSEGSKIISTGGGAILREENVRYLKQNGKLFFINADINRLQATDNRPLSDTYEKLQKLYDERIDIYKATADVVVPDMETAKLEADYIMLKRKEIMQLGTEV
ncbi:MAG: shikimate kinase [Lachnospiraceae bacterium]|nr:shikimate kinase [Lachnospiraceae bacterium]